jgi:DNA polymerase-3 subunit delta
MSITPAQLQAQLKSRLAPAYLLAGEEPLLLQEAADDIRAKARAGGYSERDVLHVDAHFDWDQLHAAGENLSLFASHRILEVRLGDKSPGVDGSRALKEWLGKPSPDTLLILHAGALDKGSRDSAWFAAFEKHGVAVYAWPVRLEELPRWIENRLRPTGLRAVDDAIELLAARTEGNLLACAQEIEKLKLLCPDGLMTPARVLEAAADSANFDAFDLVEKAFCGQQAATVQVVSRLREEGVDVVPIMGALIYALRVLYLAGRQVAAGQSVDSALAAARIFGPRQNPYKQALRRLPPDKVLDFIKDASWVDRAAKGAAPAEPWPELLKLATRLSGVPLRASRPV